MKRIFQTHWVSMAIVSCKVIASAQPYFVSPSGDDTNPGTLEKPFVTLQRAQQAVRQRRGDVFLRGGTYYLPDTLIFTAQDSGTKDEPVVFQNYRDEQRSSAAASGLPVWNGSLTRKAFFRRKCRWICRK